MRPRARQTAIASAMAGALLAIPVHAEEAPEFGESRGGGALLAGQMVKPVCEAGQCTYRLAPAQLLALAERLVLEKKFDEARPLVTALQDAPGMALPYHFLEGLIATETGDPKAAVDHFRAILKDHPGQTRVRLELAKALLMQGKLAGADYHLRLAQNDEELPEDIARMISNTRSIIRSNRKLRFGFEFGIAPDTNINSATAAETVDVNFGPVRVPLSLDEKARARSGIGLTASAYAGLRLPAAERLAIVVDADAAMINYEGSDVDDYTLQMAAGPELKLGRRTNVTMQGLGLYRWYGGDIAQRQFGSRLTVQHNLDQASRFAVQIDGRRTESGINEGYNGWQIGGNATYERVIGKSMIASVSVFARREFLDNDAFSNRGGGVAAGIGGELPFGINAGASGSISHARYDEAQPFFSFDSRKDWRYQARAYAGLRQIRVAGFSPSAEYAFIRVASNYDFYRSERHRFEFKLARYF